jgi:predicted Zn-dependent peptidase
MFERSTLPNGLRVLTATMPHTRSVTVSIYVGAGSRYETQPVAGISHFVEHMCFKGTEKRPTAKEVSEVIDGVGGIMNAATDRELTVYYCKVARPHFETAMDVLTDMLEAPLFDPVEVEKERKVVLEEIAATVDSPSQLVDVLIDEVMWPDQPLGWDVAGTPESVADMSRDDLYSYLRRQYVPNNMVVAVAGNVTHEEVLACTDRFLGPAPAGKPGTWSPAIEPSGGPRLRILSKKTEQAHVSLSVRGVPLRHPDRHAVDLLSVALGEGMSSRLFVELREERGLCYDVHSYTTHFLDTGAFTLYAAVDPPRAGEATSALLDELGRLRAGMPEEELAKAKELSKGRLLLRMEDTRSVSGWLGGQECLLGEVRSVDEVVDEIERVTVADVRRVANEIIVKDQLCFAAVGPFRSEKRFAALLKL